MAGIVIPDDGGETVYFEWVGITAPNKHKKPTQAEAVAVIRSRGSELAVLERVDIGSTSTWCLRKAEENQKGEGSDEE